MYMKLINPQDLPFALDPLSLYEPFAQLMLETCHNPEPLFKTQKEFLEEYNKLVNYAIETAQGKITKPVCEPDAKDKRFSYHEWQENLFFDFIKQYYLMASRHIEKFCYAMPHIDNHTKDQAAFFIKQMLNMLSPSNFIHTNPEIIQSIFKDSGKGLMKGLSNFFTDIDKNYSLLDIYKARNHHFKVGIEVASTKGEVVYKNDLIELIYYTPTTEKTHQVPLLIIPPWINKYYILDLSPKQSMVKWLLDNGFPVFMISWVNPGKSLKHKSFDDYLLEGPLAAMNFLEEKLNIKKVNILGYCIGGVLACILMAYLKYHKQEDRINSSTLMTTILDYSDAGEISAFLSEEQIKKIEQVMQKQEYFDGKIMSVAFNLLRSNDMIWSVLINNYLLGKKPLPFEVLYWNSDSTRMTPPLHSYYLRNMYLRNNLIKPNKLTIAKTPINIYSITTPCYFVSAIEDHIAPWKGTYRASSKIPGQEKFVLAGSGHVFGMINPPYKNKYHYWTKDDTFLSSAAWLTHATKNPGSWWNDWLMYLKKYSGPEGKNLPQELIKNLSLYEAPGKYVKVK